MNTRAAAILADNPYAVLHLSCPNPRNPTPWYAAFREDEATELTPELGWGYGATPEEAIEAACADYERRDAEG